MRGKDGSNYEKVIDEARERERKDESGFLPDANEDELDGFSFKGWYWIINSCDLKPGDVKAIGYCGRHVVLFRGKNGKPYVLDAYCAHMGANLGEGGKVRHDTCIECPFHGWMFDGETGNCVLSGGENKITRVADKYQYYDIEKCTPGANREDHTAGFLEKVADQEEVRIKKYVVRELNGSVFAWYHSDEKLHNAPLYEPFDLTGELTANKMEGRTRAGRGNPADRRSSSSRRVDKLRQLPHPRDSRERRRPATFRLPASVRARSDLSVHSLQLVDDV